MVRIRAIGERLRLSLWLIPTVLVVVASLSAVVLEAIDQRLALEQASFLFAFGGSPEGARTVLSAIAQSMLTFTALVFSITMLVLQLASSQLSPRVMRTFLRDRGNQTVLGLFVATFVFTLLVLREVRTPVDGGQPFVPAISVWVAFALLLLSVAAFVWYIDHMAHAIRASSVIVSIWDETTRAIDGLYPESIGRDPEPPLGTSHVPTVAPDLIIMSAQAGVVVGVDEDQLVAVTGSPDRVLELLAAIGDFVPEGAPLARAWGPWDGNAADSVRAAIGIGRERTVEQDAAFGFRQLVDVAVRALSPGINDPTTAVQVLDRIHDLLRRLGNRRFPSRERVVEGRVRFVLPRPSWDDYVGLAVDEIRLAGREQLQVVRRMRSLLHDLAVAVPPDRRPPLEAELEALDLEAHRGVPGDVERETPAGARSGSAMTFQASSSRPGRLRE